MNTEGHAHDDTPTCLFTEQHVDADVFEFLWCPFCGNQSFVDARFDGVRCAGCNASVRIQRWSTGLHAIFGEDTPEFVPPDEDLRRPPDTPVYVEIVETDVGYQMRSFEDGGEWNPKQPTEYVRENDAGPSTPFMRWDGRDTSDKDRDG